MFNKKNQFLRADVGTAFLQKQFDLIHSLANVNILWLGCSGNSVYPLRSSLPQMTFCQSKDWTLEATNIFYDNVVKGLGFKESSYNGVDDYAHEEALLWKALRFSVLPAIFNSQILVVKDIAISSFPHNLLNDENGLLVLRHPITNVISLEWLQDKLKSTIRSDFSVSMWLPLGTAFDEFVILNIKLEETIRINNITLENGEFPGTPMHSTINVIVAHGSPEITSYPALTYSGHKVATDLNKIVGAGKVLILFVCHGGLTKSDVFRSQVASLTTQYLREGYEAVIAPFWKLSTAVPDIWLPEFLKHIRNGMEVSQAVWHANNTVKQVYNSPNAYACMHLYGNPFFTTSK